MLKNNYPAAKNPEPREQMLNRKEKIIQTMKDRGYINQGDCDNKPWKGTDYADQEASEGRASTTIQKGETEAIQTKRPQRGGAEWRQYRE